MSSEDDDQEEEELLQRALADQARRDTNYSRPPSQPPPLVSGMGPPSRRPPTRPPPKAAPPPPPPDEESEEELLSISSDEDSRPIPAAQKPKTRVSDELDDFSDAEWDEADGEPKNWKTVDEDELSRRVREIRETRAAPIANVGRLKKSVHLGRGTTLIAEPLPRGEDLVDPLGLGVIDIRALTLIPTAGGARGNDALTSPSRQSTQVVRDHALREKVIYHSETFDPKFFLARIHQNTSAAELEAGDSALKEDLQNRKQQLKRLVKENFDCFISCKNTIDDIHSKLQQIESDPNGSGTRNLYSAIQDVDAVAKRAFGPLLERQAQTERIRSVQGMLQRFRTLFNLPSTIRSNIAKGEYDMAVREYKKAKSIVLPSHISILKKVFEEVEKVVQELKDILYKYMEDPHVELSQLENTIRLLLELEPDSDPIWHYLSIQDRRIRGLIESCVIEYETHVDALYSRVREKVQSDARWKQLQKESQSTAVDLSILMGDQDKEYGEAYVRELSGDESDALLGRLIRRLSTVIVRYVPNFWRLALSVFEGKFATASRGSATDAFGIRGKENQDYYAQNQAEDLTYTAHSLDEVIAMVHGIILLYDSKVQTASLGLADASATRPYMREALGEIFKVCIVLEEKDCVPLTAVEALFALHAGVTRLFISKLCDFMHASTLDLVREEDWVPVPAVEQNGSPFAISSLPLKFQNMLVASIEHIMEMVERIHNIASINAEINAQAFEIEASLRNTFFHCFLDLAEYMEKLVNEISQADLQDGSGRSDNDRNYFRAGEFVGLQMGLEVSNPHQKLLMILSNAGYIKDVLLPELLSKYEHVLSYGEESASPTAKEVESSLSALELTTLNQYNNLKAVVIETAATAYILDDPTLWGSAPPVKGVRDAVIELMYPMVKVHAEVYAGAKPFLQKVLSVLTEGLMVALLKILTEHKTNALDINGYCQLMLELEYLNTVLQVYSTPGVQEANKSVKEILLEKVLASLGDSIENMGHNRRPTRGSEDGFDDRYNAHMTADDVEIVSRQINLEHLAFEVKRTRLNSICFIDEQSISDFNSRNGGSVLANSSAGVFLASKTTSRHQRRVSAGSSISDDSVKVGLPPPSPYHSDFGNENESRTKTYHKGQSGRSYRRTKNALDDDLR